MYLIEHFSRLQPEAREDSVSVFFANMADEQVSPEAKEAIATFMRMAATFAKQAVQSNRAEHLERGCRMLNRAMEDCSHDR